MVKIISRLCGLVLAVILSLSLASPVLAESQPQTFCQKVSDFTTSASTQLNSRLEDLKKAHRDQASELANNRAQNSQKLAQARAQWGEKKALQYDKLMARAADSQSKKDAILAFRSGIEAATVERQNKIDNIIATYRVELDNAIAERNSAIDQAAGLFESTFNQAFADAKTNCTADASTVKQTLVTKITTARQMFKDRVASINTSLDERLKGIQARQSDLDAAAEKFRQKAQAFRDSLNGKLDQ